MEIRQTTDSHKGFDAGYIKKVDDFYGRLDVPMLVDDVFSHREIVVVEQQCIPFVQKDIEELIETVE
jgi:hypothetical protein